VGKINIHFQASAAGITYKKGVLSLLLSQLSQTGFR